MFHKDNHMKQLLPNHSRRGFMPLMLLGAMLISCTAEAQDQEQNINVNNFHLNANVTGNQSFNTRNVNTSIPSGPNGSGSLRAININVIDNGTGLNFGGPNVRGYTSSVVPKQTGSRQTNKAKTSGPVAVQPARPKPAGAAPAVRRSKPATATTAPVRRATRPAGSSAAAPVIMAQTQALPADNLPVQVSNPPVAVEQVLNNDAVAPTSNVAPASAPILSLPTVRSSAASAGSGSSGRSHRSISKKHRSFSYKANKRMAKLFAKSKNRKFDPAKCFVWK